MKLYAELPARLTRQVLLDLAVLLWSLLWVRAGSATHAALLRLVEPGRALQGAGQDLAGALGDAARRTSGIPLVGDPLAGPLTAAGDAARRLADAGAAEQGAAGRVALLVGGAVTLAPVAAVLLPWLALRLRWIQRASAAASLRGRHGAAVTSESGKQGRPGGLDAAAGPAPELELLALRALVTRPVAQLLRTHPAPGTAFRHGDPEAIRLLAGLELRALGLRP